MSNLSTAILPPPAPAVRTARLAVVVLAFCCICWGVSFPLMQISTTAFAARTGVGEATQAQLAAQATFNVWRFGLAAIIYWLLTRPRQRNFSPADWHAGVFVGLFFGGAMYLQVVGLRYTLPSVSGFLTALAVVFAPVAQALLFRRRVRGMTWAAVALALAGMVLLSQPNPAAVAERTLALVPPVPYLGEILTVAGAVLFTAQILALDRLGPGADVARLTSVMFATTALVNLAGGLALGGARFYHPQMLLAVVADPTFLWSMVILVLVSAVLALHLMNMFQPLVCPATAAVIYCLEPVFATGFSVAFGTESFARLTAAGGGLVLLAVLLVARTRR